MEEWDLVEEFFNWIREPEEEDETRTRARLRMGIEGREMGSVFSLCLLYCLLFIYLCSFFRPPSRP